MFSLIWTVIYYIRFILLKTIVFLTLAPALFLPYRMRARYSEILVKFGESIEKNILSQPAPRYFRDAERCVRGKEYATAIKMFRKAEIFNNLNHDININIAECYKKLGRMDKYASELARAVHKHKIARADFSSGGSQEGADTGSIKRQIGAETDETG